MRSSTGEDGRPGNEDMAAESASSPAPLAIGSLLGSGSPLLEIFEQSPAMMAVMRGPEHRIHLANTAFTEAIGIPNAVGEIARDVFSGPDAADLLAAMNDACRTGLTSSITEQRLRTGRTAADAQDAFFNFACQPLRGPDSAVQGILLHGVDVTLQVRARHDAQDQAAELEMQSEELQAQASELEMLYDESRATANRLARSEALLAEAQRMARVGSWEWDVATGSITWSEELFLLLGEEPGGVDVSMQAYLDRIHPDDRPGVRGAVDAALADLQPFTFDHRVIRADGGVRDFSCRGRVWTDGQGRPVRMSGSAQDVTEQRAAERARHEDAMVVDTLHQFGRTIATGLDADAIIQEVTDAATALTGASFGAFFYNVINSSGQSYTLHTLSGVDRDAFAGFPEPRNTPIFAPTFRGEAVIRSDDITQDDRYGTMESHRGMPAGHLPVRSYLAVPVKSRTGEVLGGLFFGHPETGRFSARHEQLAVGVAAWAAVALDNARLFRAERKARAEAEQANSAKSDFLATMSHELCTPLNAMIGYSDLMLAGIPEPVPESARVKLQRIGLSARHLLHLIEEILTFSRLEAGDETLSVQDTDAAAVMGEVQALLEPMALAKRIGLHCEMPTRPLPLRTDTRKLRQVLLNLLGNAVKFTDEGAVSLSVRVTGDMAAFHVQDTGPGIAAEHQDQIFEPFWQVEQGATRSKEGTGLGLSVARRLARLMGGDVAVDSRPGAGSHFTLLLPLRINEEH